MSFDLAFNTTLSALIRTCGPWYFVGRSGLLSYASLLLLARVKGMVWLEVRNIEEGSSLISSTTWLNPSCVSFWPLLIIVKGSSLFESSVILFSSNLVPDSLIVWPSLPDIIVSPGKGCRGANLPFTSKASPTLTSSLSISVGKAPWCGWFHKL